MAYFCCVEHQTTQFGLDICTFNESKGTAQYKVGNKFRQYQKLHNANRLNQNKVLAFRDIGASFMPKAQTERMNLKVRSIGLHV